MEIGLFSHCNPLDLLGRVEPLNESDKHEGRCLDDLYLLLKRDAFFCNVTEIVINTRILYTRYCQLQNSGDPSVHTPGGDRDLIFVASAYLSCVTWHTHYRNVQNGFWDIINVFPNLHAKYTKKEVYQHAQHMIEVFDGRIIESPFIMKKGDKSTLFHTFAMWFIHYRYFAFVERSYARLALSIVSHDASKGTPVTLHDEWRVRLVCQLIVLFFREFLKAHYSDKPGSIEALLLSTVSVFNYLDASGPPYKEYDDADSDPGDELNGPLEDGLLEMTGVLSDSVRDNGTLVFRAILRSHRRDHYTVKRYLTHTSSGHLFAYIREVSILALFREYPDHIGTALHVSYMKEGGYSDIYMSPYGTNLLTFVYENEAFFSVSALESLFHDMAIAIALCAHFNVVHNDVKPDNFIVEDGRAKLIDFGLATCHFSYLTDHTDNVQTLSYRAPELLLGDNAYTNATDIWALACTVYEICTHRRLFEAKESDCVDFDRHGTPTLVRARQLHIMRYRCDTLGSEAYLETCPCWKEVVCTPVVLNATYQLSDWADVPSEIEPFLRECLKFTPSDRPSARNLARRLRRDESLF